MPFSMKHTKKKNFGIYSTNLKIKKLTFWNFNDFFVFALVGVKSVLLEKGAH